MKTSNIGIELIKQFEGLHDGDLTSIGLQPKLCPANIWTIGYGRALRYNNGKFVRGDRSDEELALIFPYYKTITKKDAEKFLKEDLKKFEEIVLRNVERDLMQHEFDAIVSHTYNTGGSETLFKLIANGNIEEIEQWWTETYISANGVRFRGLVIRRKVELTLFKTGILNIKL